MTLASLHVGLLYSIVRTRSWQHSVMSQVRAAVGVAGSIVAGLPPSAKKLQGDDAADRAGLAAIAEAEPDAVEPAQQLRSVSSLAADEAAAQSSKGEGQAAGSSLRRGPSRKRSSQSVPLEPVPEHAEKVKRPKHAPAATENITVALGGSPPKAGVRRKGGEKATAAEAVAVPQEDVAAVDPTQGESAHDSAIQHVDAF
jgi:hypothetical protein